MPHKFVSFVFLFLSLLLASISVQANEVWGKDYFPNTELTTHEGKKVKFFDDLIEGKVVAINFIYTNCPDVCPLETAQLIKVQRILGDKLGKDIHFYSITIDPENDTPEVLADYRGKFRAKWTFLTGDREEIIDIRRKLGLYIEGVDDGPNKNNHNVSMIIGNQATGRWMKRSPFENPTLLAEQIEHWLTGWKTHKKTNNYADAPKLRQMHKAENLFRTRCSSCHSVDGNELEGALGPDLVGVTLRREEEWLGNWLLAPDRMIAKKDPIAMALLKQYNGVAMPNLRLNREEVGDLIDYMKTLVPLGMQQEAEPAPAELPVIKKDVVAIMDAWIKEGYEGATANAGYMTLFNVTDRPIKLKSAYTKAFGKVEFHEMKAVDGLMQMNEVSSDELIIEPGKKLEFKMGGKHFMMMSPKASVKHGDVIDINLVFESGAEQEVTARVRKID